jgi:hypothetical protein
MLEIGKRYVRRAPEGDEVITSIKNDADLAYHQGLEKEGFKYSELRVSAPPEDSCPSCSA